MSKKIFLIIQDNQIAKPIADFLEEIGYIVHTCQDAKIAISMVVNLNPHLIICDDYLPHISGKELARLFKRHEKLNSIPFLLLTSSMPSMGDMDRAGFRVDADEFIQLPINQAQLFSIVSKWLESDSSPHPVAEKIAGPLADRHRPTKTMRPWNKGHINAASLGRLLFQIVRADDSGVLRVKGDRRTMRAIIKGAKLVDVVTNYIREDTLGRFLIDINKITVEQNEQSLKTALSKNLPQGKILTQIGAITETELEYFVSQQKLNKFLNLFTPSWENAAFEFISERVEAKDIEMEPIFLNKALLKGVFVTAAPEALVETFVRNKKENLAMEIDKHFEQVVKALSLNSQRMEQIRNIQGHSLNQLRDLDPENYEENMRLAFLLIVTKAFRFGETVKSVEKDRLSDEPITDVDIMKKRPPTQFGQWNADLYHKELAEGQTLFNKHEFPDAQPHLEKALEINPESTQAMSLLAWTNYQLAGKDNITVAFESKEMLKKAISIDDQNDLAFLFLGKLLKQEGKDGLAGTYFKRALEVNPANEEARREVKLLQIKRRKDKDLGFRS